MTIYDIAREAGVAASTVSRVINNKPGIRKETRERVKQLLEKYDYTPDAAARGLVMQSTKMIGILIVDIRVTHHVNSAFFIEKELAKRGYCCIIMGTGPTDEMKEEYIKILQQRRVEGVILMGSMYMTEKIKKNIQTHLSNVPVVMVNGYLDLPNVSGVLVDEDTGIYKCVNYLRDKGKQKIAFVLDSMSPSNGKKIQGYRDGMRDNGCAKEDIWIYKCRESSLKGGYDATVDVLKEHPDTQGIIYSVDLAAVGGIRAALDMGYDVPGQLGLIGVDNSIYGEICMPKLTTLNNKLEEMSEAAASILYAGLLGKGKNQKVMLYSEIIEREST
ncbi:MAG: LacI family transcriptional regulator [Lachnospiraceae bacterium]|nr:LacI family transcriptional regulator [Lachnospiraceae bacterium]MDE6979968.1 LacI family transcriptional regulator [Lachnospiraceae bacterium]